MDFFFGNPGKLHKILRKIVAYQKSLPDGRPVELAELEREGVLSPADIEFMSTNSVTYKPHRVSDYHAIDMLDMPKSGGGCVFIGPTGRQPSQRRAKLGDLQPIIEKMLTLPRPREELLLHIELAKQDGMGIAPKSICFTIRSSKWRQRLPHLRSVAAELGFSPFQDKEVQRSHILSFQTSVDNTHTASTAVALLNRGCGFSDDAEITYAAGALDEA